MTNTSHMAQINGIPDRFRTNIFASMSHNLKTIFNSLFINRSIILSRSLAFSTTKSNTNNIFARELLQKIIVVHCIFAAKSAANIHQKLNSNTMLFLNFSYFTIKNSNHFVIFKTTLQKRSWSKKSFRINNAVFNKITSQIIKDVIKIFNRLVQSLNLQKSLNKAIQVFISKKLCNFLIGHFFAVSLFVKSFNRSDCWNSFNMKMNFCLRNTLHQFIKFIFFHIVLQKIVIKSLPLISA